ncbi:outer membrane lipoprotein-sorting protein [Fulvivirgaceae bacterium BMA10]|uniref:Outer membrane lipoprotein-sorting protein n=1 Tax=Splendidivirga corallicola TaxID=3051826 RepID=A0ABT8KMA5_9BACT|nr:outer membrane lipoprotein-sorting protein [Fulvivirgaceae bacterium BMA10]
MKRIAYLAITLFSSAAISMAQSPEQKGLDIAQKADEVDHGFESSSSTLTMILKNKHGQESTRKLSNQTLELVEDGDKSMIVFNSPRDVKGTATLTYTHKEGADDQWLYLPALKRVKRISSNNKSGPFMGSEFAYEDLSSQEVEKYTYKFLKEESLNGEACYAVERDPVDPNSGYSRQIAWYNKGNYRIEKIEYYDRKNALLKTLTFKNYQQYLNKHWRAGEMVMVNHQSNKETTLIFDDYQFKLGLTDNDFTQNSLKRSR